MTNREVSNEGSEADCLRSAEVFGSISSFDEPIDAKSLGIILGMTGKPICHLPIIE